MDSVLRSPLSSSDAKEPIPPSPYEKNSTPPRSPLSSSDDAGDPIPPSPNKKNPPPSPLRSPLSSSSSVAEDPIPPSPKKTLTPPPPPPNPRSPFPDAEDPTLPMSLQAGGREGAVASPLPSPAREAENSNSIPQRKLPLIFQLARDGSLGSPARSPLRETTAGRRDGSAGSPLRPTPREELFPLALPAPPVKEAPEKPAFLAAAEAVPVAAAHRLLKDELGVVTKAEGYGSGPRVVPGMVRRRAVRRTALGLRISALLLCLVAFSVMTADRTAGWAGDSFDRYDEYRYLVSVNVIAFVYSGFQVCAQIHYMIKKKHIIRGPMQYYFAFSMDQVLAYLLMSASSSAATRNDSWVSMFGNDDFTNMANASIAMSFLAFVALALSSLISVYSLFRWRA